jgi:hypothetical protein
MTASPLALKLDFKRLPLEGKYLAITDYCTPELPPDIRLA